MAGVRIAAATVSQNTATGDEQSDEPLLLALPPEIRVMVYENLLLDPGGVHIDSRSAEHRREVFHTRPDLCQRGGKSEARGGRGRRPASLEELAKSVERQKEPTNARDEVTGARLTIRQVVQRVRRGWQGSAKRPRIWPSILATCRVVRAEALHVLYAQRFVFSNTTALFEFLLMLGTEPLSELRDLEILSWGDQRSMESEAIPAFALLPRASHLQALRISCSLGRYPDWAWSNTFGHRREDQLSPTSYHLPTEVVTTKVYRDCHHWLRVLFGNGKKRVQDGACEDGMCRIRSVLRLDKKNFFPEERSLYPIPPFSDELYAAIQARFWAYLEVLLEVNDP